MLALHNAVVFHDVERTASFFIHFSPALISWTVRWRADNTPLLGISVTSPPGSATWSQVALVPLLLYGAWWAIYGTWLLAIGYRLPDQGWGRSSFQDAREQISKVYGVNKPRSQAVCYLVTHACVCCASIVLIPPVLYRSFVLHTVFLAVLLCSAVFRGAKYYEYSFGTKLDKALRQALQAQTNKAK